MFVQAIYVRYVQKHYLHYIQNQIFIWNAHLLYWLLRYHHVANVYLFYRPLSFINATFNQWFKNMATMAINEISMDVVDFAIGFTP